MSRSVHQMLIHDSQTTYQSSLLIVLLREETQKALSANYKQPRTHITRKMNRILANEDLINAFERVGQGVVASDDHCAVSSGQPMRSESTQ